MNQPVPIENAPPNRHLTLPNGLSVLRFIGSWGMLWAAYQGQPHWVVGLFLFLTATDWVDGKLAILLHQRSKIGPKLDTIADVTMYVCLIVATLLLHHDVLWEQLGAYLIGTAAIYLVSIMFSVYKFRRIPSYHTRAAKTCTFLMLVGILSLFLGWSIWPLRIALIGVILANLEAIAITYLASEPLSDIEHVGLVKRS
ncbi:CDP-alcohol phosphatidyltransferase family protein [Roseimaritima ulvae]|uniref:CDP-diacylglycerol--glycerol-3-phosphate 3-phosphatidyltransferase n=1 Tax=Roseimaritima ulvae TaxID=980254 RepID=A0A5B9R3I1_9BACT|nr:CDP-alcohol phosphatidyltransferase family protein [Roseimaritima ulvae]QEG40883.1 CDP-diacylglycerol--glycerol-3-phosphate 3-phosphatidyltransferase [Roseimaritima ulvae]